MKIGGIKNTEKYGMPSKVFGKVKDGVVALGFVALATGGMHAIKQTEENKAFVKQNNRAKYEKMVKDNAAIWEWSKAKVQVRDSLMADSIAKTNYAKGLQAVRDSLKNTEQ